MDEVITVDGNVEEFRSSHSTSAKIMNRSPSEWAFQRFLQEAAASVPQNSSITASPASSSTASTTTATASTRQQPPQNDVVEIADQKLRTDRNIKFGNKSSGAESAMDNSKTTSLGAGRPANFPVDADEYQAFLKSRLYLACAAVAFSRGNCVEPQVSAAVDNGLEVSISNPGSLVTPKGSGNDFPKGQEKNAEGPVGMPTLSAVQNKCSAQVRSSSGSEQSDDDEAEGEVETIHPLGATDAKRARRMLSNRESARRSRRRKQVHLTELESQVSQLKVENSSLLKRFADISQKHNDAAVDNRILKADVETLRAKVKMAEETVKRMTGMNPVFQAISELTMMSSSSFPDSPSDTSADASLSLQDDTDHHYYQTLCQIPAQESRFQTGLAPAPIGNGGGMGSMNRLASLEHLQKRIRGEGGGGSCGSQSRSSSNSKVQKET